MSTQGDSQWKDLPPELISLIIRKLIGFGIAGNDSKAMANLRSTCKAWRAACSQFPASLFCKCPEDLSWLCSAYPRLAGLEIIAELSPSDLRTLSSCTQLTSLTLKQPPTPGRYADIPPMQVDLHHLPDGLRELELHDVLPIGSFGKLRDVTSLGCCLLDNGHQDALSALLQELPNLKVISLDLTRVAFQR